MLSGTKAETHANLIALPGITTYIATGKEVKFLIDRYMTKTDLASILEIKDTLKTALASEALITAWLTSKSYTIAELSTWLANADATAVSGFETDLAALGTTFTTVNGLFT